jgi:DNA-binding transcriptional MerR regulator
MDFSGAQTAKLLSNLGCKIEPATLRLYVKRGLFHARKTPRGDLVFSEKEIPRLAKIILARRASRRAAFNRGRMLAVLARRSARG